MSGALGAVADRVLVRDAVGEDERIDAFVRAHPDATPFHLTGWTKAVEVGCGQRGLRL